MDKIGAWFGRTADEIFGTTFYLDPTDIEKRKLDAQGSIAKVSQQMDDNAKEILAKQEELNAARLTGDAQVVADLNDQLVDLKKKQQDFQDKKAAELEKIKTAEEDQRISRLTDYQKFMLGLENLNPFPGLFDMQMKIGNGITSTIADFSKNIGPFLVQLGSSYEDWNKKTFDAIKSEEFDYRT